MNILAILCNRIKWEIQTKKLGSVGNHTRVGNGFNIIGPDDIFIGDYFAAGKNLYLQVWKKYNDKELAGNHKLCIGNNVSFMDNDHISCANKIQIGNGVLLGDNVFITDNFHGDGRRDCLDIPPLQRDLYVKGNVQIGDNVWIGRNVCIMPGVKIGNGAIVGANAVVTSDIPDYSVAAGVPAKVIKHC